MNDIKTSAHKTPPEQQAIKAKCFHPSGVFTPFSWREIERSVADRFEETVWKYPNGIAIESTSQKITSDDLNTIGRTEHLEKRFATNASRIPATTNAQRFTYDSFNRMANRVAWAILSRRGDANEPIALLLEQSAQSIAARFWYAEGGQNVCAARSGIVGW